MSERNAEIRRRTIAANALYGIGNVGCHDVQIVPAPAEALPTDTAEYFIVSVDLSTGELSTRPDTSEQ